MSAQSLSLAASRILVIDDNPAIHEDFRKILCPSKIESHLEADEALLFGKSEPAVETVVFEIDSAFQGREGLERVEEALRAGRPYSMAFVDVRMPPGWDGVETILRIWKCSPELQVVICTAYSDYSWEEIVRQLGHSDSLVILKKPFDSVEVLQLAHALTKKWSVTRQANFRMADLDRLVQERTHQLTEANSKLRDEIEQRAIAQEALRSSEERFSKAFGASPIPLFTVSRDGDVVMDANPSFCEMSARPTLSVVGHKVSGLGLWEDEGVWENIHGKIREREVVRNLPARIRRADSGLRDVLVSVETMTLSSGACLLVITQDITDQLKLESQLRQAQKMEAIGQLAAGVAHDFNNILTVIHGHATLQLCNDKLDREVVDSLQQVRLASERAAALTRQLLAFSRKQVSRAHRVSVLNVVREIEAMLRRLLDERVQLECDLPLDLPEILGDESGLEQIILNLVVNARDAMPKGGRVIVRVSKRVVRPDEPRKALDARPGEFVCLSVLDNGTGIDPAVLPRVFEPFFTTKEVGKGTGLGLSTVYAVVKQHRGWVEVASGLGQGTTFDVYLPCLREDESLNCNTTIFVKRRQDLKGSESLMVVEDDPALRSLASMTLRRQGYAVIEAEDGMKALDLVRSLQAPLDLVLTDVILPGGMGGRDLAQRLLAEHPSLRVVFTSGYSPELMQDDFALMEGVNFLSKPFEAHALLETVRHCLDAVQSSDRTIPPGAFEPLATLPRRAMGLAQVESTAQTE